MTDTSKIERLAALLVEARRSNGVATVPADLVPADADAADAVQEAAAASLGPIAAYKVLQVADNPGSWGAIYDPGLFNAPAKASADGIRMEAEVAFRFNRDLTGRADGKDYTLEEVEAAIEGACPVFELVQSRLPSDPKPPALLARADTMSNWGLVVGPVVADWRSVAHDHVHVEMTIGGRAIVNQTGGHPSGNPAHALHWLANALVRRGHGITAGTVVTTGAFGGAHPIAPGEQAVATIEGLGTIAFTLA